MLAHLKIVTMSQFWQYWRCWQCLYFRRCWQCWQSWQGDNINNVESVDIANNFDIVDNFDNVDNVDNVDKVDYWQSLKRQWHSINKLPLRSQTKRLLQKVLAWTIECPHHLERDKIIGVLLLQALIKWFWWQCYVFTTLLFWRHQHLLTEISVISNN